ncbi:hypothetical protein NPIL_35831 [Nephila pilipes]|uniref:Uncharacterized protein n=1 Tax=Nephila pilipes TaxID=299642 RepID=A0A8X6TGD1_NEPPI|nr:hypothetical protein NPIL_35831 [Nephila pilipes]
MLAQPPCALPLPAALLKVRGLLPPRLLRQSCMAASFFFAAAVTVKLARQQRRQPAKLRPAPAAANKSRLCAASKGERRYNLRQNRKKYGTLSERPDAATVNAKLKEVYAFSLPIPQNAWRSAYSCTRWQPKVLNGKCLNGWHAEPLQRSFYVVSA